MSWSSGLQLRILQGHNQGQVLPLTERSVVLCRAAVAGESAKGYLFFHEATVSRMHAELRWDDKKGYSLHQRSQTNKTLLDNTPVDAGKPRVVKAGSRIRMGLLELGVEAAE